jgi:hypothetical protein
MAGPSTDAGKTAAKTKKAVAVAPVQAPPKSTILNFFSKAPAPPSNASPAAGHEENENTEGKASDDDVIMCDEEGVKLPATQGTPLRPPSLMKDSPKSSSQPSASENAKIINLSKDGFGKIPPADKDDSDDACIMIHGAEDDNKSGKATGAVSVTSQQEKAADSSTKEKKAGGTTASQNSSGKEPARAKASAAASAPSVSKSTNASKGAKKTVTAAPTPKTSSNPVGQKSGTCSTFFKPAEKKEVKQKARPPHPEGKRVDMDEDLLMVAQFASTFG